MLPGIAAALVSTIPGYGLALSSIVYAGIYFIETWIEQLDDAATMANLQKSLTFYDIDDSTKDIPNSLNEKVKQDRSWGDSDKDHPNHRSAYYYTIYGGEPGKDYTADLVIAPPRAFRGNGETFESYNLDYFFLTSELASLKDKPYITDVIIGTSPKTYVDTPDEGETQTNAMGLEIPQKQDQKTLTARHEEGVTSEEEKQLIEQIIYDYYRHNTIGAIEQNIQTESRNIFDTIRPYFTNGVPEYRFVNSKDIELTKTLSPLYRPIIVSEERYNQMVDNGEYTQSEIIIDLNAITSSNGPTSGMFDYGASTLKIYLTSTELEKGYKEKFPLSNKGFYYPITKITIGGKIIPNSYYKCEDGNLYFYDTISKIVPNIPLNLGNMFDYGTDEPIPSSSELHIYFDTISYLGVDALNTNDKTARYALAQTLSYSISDYFNQYYIASTNAKRQAELDFTVQTTGMSTLLSTLILAPVTITASVYRSGNSIGKIVVGQLVKIPSAVMEETFEELYLDPLIENFIKTRFDLLEGDEDLGNLLSLLATSMREGFGGLGRFSSHDFSMDVSQSGLLALSAQYGDAFYQSQLAPSQSNPASSIGMTSIAAGASGFGLLFGLASLGLDKYLDSNAVNIYLNAFTGLFSESMQQLIYDLEMDLAASFADQQYSENLVDLTQPLPPITNINPLNIHKRLKMQTLADKLMDDAISASKRAIQQKQANIEANKKLVNLLAENRKRFESLETKSQDNPRRFPI
ncbi:hypothetical protein LCGC14_1564810, partial [marine sediment metagenome]